jgi:hypothetical protein
MADKDNVSLAGDWGDGKHTSFLVPAETGSDNANLAGDWGDGSRSSYLEEEATPEFLPANVGEVEVDPELRATWEKEGGYERNLAQAQAGAKNILECMESPKWFQARFDALPASIQLTVFDHLRMAPQRGRADAVLDAIEQRLSPAEVNIFADFLERCSADELRAIRAYLNGELR